MKKVALFVKEDDKSKEAARIILEKLKNKGFELDAKGKKDLAIAIGGDGTFLHMVKECSFSSDIIYVGINSGTLGFMQEARMDEVDAFILELEKGYYRIEEVGIQEVVVHHKKSVSRFYSLNELVIRDASLKVVRLDVEIDGNLLEKFVGDGLLIATSVGSTAHNLSYGGSIVMDTFSTLQITPMAPINSKVYRSLINSVIVGHNREISLRPTKGEGDYILTIDGENKLFNGIETIKSKLSSKTIKCLRLSHHNFPQKVNEKLLSN